MLTLFCFIIPLLLPATTFAQQTQCYDPFGAIVPNTDFVPCPNSTICCALNRPDPPGSDGDARDVCLPNGLCLDFRSDGREEDRYYRNYCTLQEWRDGGCLNLCTDNVLSEGNQRMTPCDGTNSSTKWCCGTNTNCCNDDKTVQILAQKLGDQVPVLLPTSSASSTSISALTDTSHSTSTSSSSAPSAGTGTPVPTGGNSTAPSTGQPSPSPSLSTGAKAGIGIGATFGALLLFVLGFVVARSAKLRHHSSNHFQLKSPPTAFPLEDIKQGGVIHYRMSGESRKELDGVGVVVELGGRDLSEMP